VSCCVKRLSRLTHVANFLSPVKMGMADAIVDLVSSGTTLRENNLKEIDGGVVLESQVNFLSHTCMFWAHTLQ